MKFLPGRLVATPGATELMQRVRVSPLTVLARHLEGDWSDHDPEDAQANEYALENDKRITSVYDFTEGGTIWVITEADRSVTTILLPDEY